MVAQTTPTIDVHAHILTEETIRLLQSEAPKVAPKLSDIDDQFGTLDVAGSVYRHFPRGGWDLERRLQDMAASKVDVQVLSVCPQTFVYAQPPALAAAFARIQNEQLAKLVKARPDRFLAIATLPMQAPKLAADELRHAVRDARIARRTDRLERGGQEPRRSRARAGLGHGRGARRLHPAPSHQRGGGRPAVVVLSQQSDRQSARYHHRRRVPGVQRRARAPSVAENLPRPWRRVRALPGRALRARLACARGAEAQAAQAADGVARSGSTSIPSCTRKRCWNSWSATRAPIACCSAATIPSTWACRTACCRFAVCRSPRPTSHPFSAGGRKALLGAAGDKTSARAFA